MTTFLIRRLLQAIVVIFGVSVIVFLALFATGNPARLMLPPEATQQEVDELTHQLGFDRPIYLQYASFISNAVRGDFGNSLWYHEPAGALVLERLPATVELAFSGLLLAVVCAVPLGVLAAVRRGRWVDTVTQFLVTIGQSVPIFWLGLVLILVFSVNLHLLPTSGRGTWQQLVLPAVTLAAYSIARLTRLTRSGMLEVLGQDYIRTARAKGLPERAVIYRHGLRNALIPLITYLGLEFGGLLGGAVVTEVIFSWPGVGRLAVDAIFNRDFPLVQAVVFLVAITFVVINLIVDLLYPIIDPRIRFGVIKS